MTSERRSTFDSLSAEARAIGYGERELENVLTNLIHLDDVEDYQTLVARAQGAFANQRAAFAEPGRLAAVLEGSVIDGSNDITVASGPYIFVTYHYGPYRIVPAVLAHAGFDLTLLIDKDVNAQQGDQFVKAIDAETTAMGWKSDRVIIRDTSSPSFLLSVLRDLKRGRSILVYVDANKGLRPSLERDAESLAAIPFLGHELLSQRGIVALAVRSGAPLRSILATRDCLDRGPYRFAIAPIDVVADTEAVACAKLWRPLETAIKIDIVPWEALRYANQYINFAPRRVAKPRPDARQALAFNHLRFRVIEFENDDIYLYDRFVRRFRKVSGRLAELLTHVSVAEPEQRSDAISVTLAEHMEMVSMDMLT